MKTVLLTTVGLLSAVRLMADPVDSEVIHNYTFVDVGYSFLRGIHGAPDFHGAFLAGSYDFHSLVFAADGSYHAADWNGVEVDRAGVGGGIGYVFRAAENHLNIIPRFRADYSELTARLFGGDVSAHTTTVGPGLVLSWAFSDQVAVNGAYDYAYNLDTQDHRDVFHLGAVVAIAERVGLGLDTSYDTHDGFTGFSVGVSYHF